MANGRNTALVSSRISDEMHQAIKALAGNRQMTVFEYVKQILEADPELRGGMIVLRQMGRWRR